MFSMDLAYILFWNVRGFNGAGRKASIRNLVASSRIDVVYLQETKMEDISWISVLQTLGSDFSNFVFLLLVGLSGGILIAWGTVWA
jgi:exonuclease III